MKNAISKQSSYATLFDPVVARAVAERAEHWNLPRYICHPLDRYTGKRVTPDVAAFDAAVEVAPVADDEAADEPRSACGVADTPDADDEL
jgi:hypothetical protein